MMPEQLSLNALVYFSQYCIILHFHLKIAIIVIKNNFISSLLILTFQHVLSVAKGSRTEPICYFLGPGTVTDFSWASLRVVCSPPQS